MWVGAAHQGGITSLHDEARRRIKGAFYGFVLRFDSDIKKRLKTYASGLYNTDLSVEAATREYEAENESLKEYTHHSIHSAEIAFEAIARRYPLPECG